MKSAKIKILTILTFSMLLTNIEGICEDKFTLLFKKNEAVCKKCPANCKICYPGLNNKLICGFCDDGFFMDVDRKCSPCSENCSDCTGSSITDCFSPLQSYFYNDKSKSLLTCPEGCSHCLNSNECTNCKEGYLVSDRKQNENKMNVVTCKKCEIDNCKFCRESEDQVKNQKFVNCSLCESQFALVSGKCEKCPDNCIYCKENSLQCHICSKGFRLDRQNNTCIQNEISHCYMMEDDKICRSCESQFFNNEGQCQSCQSKKENCHYCSQKKDEFICNQCKIGFYETSQKSCKKCSKNCNHCNEEGCIICENGYFNDKKSGKCKKCGIKDCFQCKSGDVCKECKLGMFFDKEKKSCEICPGKCLKCSGDGSNCYSCPLDLFTLQEETITEKKNSGQSSLLLPSLLSVIFGGLLKNPNFKITEIKFLNKCVEKCPDELKGKKMKIDKAHRKCRVIFGELDSLEKELNLPTLTKSDNILQNIKSLKVKYDEEIMHIKTSAFLKKEDTKLSKSDKSGECFFHGDLKKEIKGNIDSFYICRCDQGYLGDNCQITQALYLDVQEKLLAIFEKMEKSFVNHDKHSQQILLKSLILSNKFKISHQALEKMIFILSSTLSHNREMENMQELYILYDAILLNLFDLLEELKKNPLGLNLSNADMQTKSKSIFTSIHQIVQMVEHSLEDLVYAQSFLEKGSDAFYSFDTFSYTMAEYRYKDADTSFEIRNPNIDTSFNINAYNEVRFAFEDNFDLSLSPYNVQVLNFAAPLYADRMKQYNDVLLTNLIYLKNINPVDTTQLVTNSNVKLKKIKIRFALLFIPAAVDVQDIVYCKAYSFVRNKKTFPGKFVEFDTDKATITCEFYNYFEFNNYYFGISMIK